MSVYILLDKGIYTKGSGANRVETLTGKKSGRQPNGRWLRDQCIASEQQKRGDKRESVMITLLSIYCTHESKKGTVNVYSCA